MSGIFSVLADSQSSMFRLQQAKKTWERDMEAMDAKDAKQRLSDKADAIRLPMTFSLTPEQQRNHTAAVNAMEEAKRVGGPKAAAEQKLEEVERKIAELKLTLRFSHGNRDKLAQLAREAAILAREAGRAAKSYGEGVAAAAEMGLPGGAGTGASASAGLEIEHTITRTSLTVVQTEMSVNVTMTIRPDAQPPGKDNPNAGAAALAQEAAAVAEQAPEETEGASAETEAEAADVASDASQAEATAEGEGTDEDTSETSSSSADPADLAKAVSEALAGQHPSGAGLTGERGRALMQRMMADNTLKMSRYREADEFGRRVEKVLSDVKSVIGEAKIANEADQVMERRKARKESFKAYDKIVDGAQGEVNRLRQAAFGSSVSIKDFLNAAADANGGGEGAEAGADSGGAGGAAAATAAAGPALSGAQTVVNLLA
ncbi:hypothetical protein [Azospirillum sp. sgz302134]